MQWRVANQRWYCVRLGRVIRRAERKRLRSVALLDVMLCRHPGSASPLSSSLKVLTMRTLQTRRWPVLELPPIRPLDSRLSISPILLRLNHPWSHQILKLGKKRVHIRHYYCYRYGIRWPGINHHVTPRQPPRNPGGICVRFVKRRMSWVPASSYGFQKGDRV